MKKINIERRAVTFLVLSILFVSLVTASYGVATPYWKGNPIQIAPGDTKTVSITLQSTEDTTIEMSLKKGSEIASIREGNYDVKEGTKDTEVLVTITIPENTPLGTEYEVTLGSREAVEGGTGGVSMGVSMDTTFDVLVAKVEVQKEEKDYTTLVTTLIILILVAIAVIILVTKGKKKKKK